MTRHAWRDRDHTRVVEIVPEGPGRFRATVDGAPLDVTVEPIAPGRFRLIAASGAVLAEVTAAGERRFVRLGGMDFVLDREAAGPRRGGASHASGLEAPMPGVVTRVLVAAGDEVKKGQPLVALEAMKMEHLIRAPRDGKVKSIAARAGELVNGGLALVELES